MSKNRSKKDKNKILVRIFAAAMAGLMLLGGCTSLLYMLFVK